MKMEMTEVLQATDGNVTLTHSSSLMTNYECGRVAAPGRHVTAVTDKNGHPMVFTVTPDEGEDPSSIYLTYRDETEKTGWKQINLTKSLPVSGLRCQTLTVTQYANGDITIAVAAGSALSGPSLLYVTSQLPDDPLATNWTNLKNHWRARSVPSHLSSIEIDAISMSDSPSGVSADGPGPLMFVAAKSGASTTYYIVNSGVVDPTAWTEVSPPAGANSVSQILASNSLVAAAGTYALYEHGSGAQVGFQGAPGQFISQKFTLNVSAGTQAIATGAGAGGCNSLFLAGTDGLQYFAAKDLQGNATPQSLISGSAFNGLKELAVTEGKPTDGRMTIWMLDANDNLYYSTTKKDDPANSVKGPFLFKQAVAQIASIQNHVRGSSEVILVGIDGKMSYLWQDPVTTLWTEQSIPLYTTDENLTFTCYTTALHFEDDQAVAVSTKAEIRASAWSYARINGAPYVLTPDKPVTVSTDANGAITIIQKVDKLAVPHYTVSSDSLANPVTIIPSAAIKTSLSKVQSGTDLSGAVNQNTGKPIFTQNPNFSYDDAAKSLNKLTTLHPNGATSLAQASTVTDFANQITAPANETWGLIKSSSGELIHTTGATAEAHLAQVMVGSIWDDITTTVGDGLRWVEHAAEDIASVVVQAANGVVKFVLKIGKDIVHFIVETAEQVFAAISYVLKKIGAAIEKIIEWIGFLFAWDDIVTTHSAMSAYVMKGFDLIDFEIDGAEDKVDHFFEMLKAKFEDALKIPAGTPSGQMTNKSPNSGQTNSAMKTPGGSFTNHHMQHSGILSGDGSITGGPIEGLVEWAEQIMKNEIADIKDDFMKGAKKLASLQKSNQLSAENVAKVVLEIISDTVLDTLKNIVIGALEFAKFMVDTIKRGATTTIKIPFLSALYKDISGHDLTLLDGMSLLLAIPVTLISKIAMNSAPFSDSDVTAIQGASLAQLFGPIPQSLGSQAVAANLPAPAVYGGIGIITRGIGELINMICTFVSDQSETDVPLVPKVRLATAVIVLFMNVPVQPGPTFIWRWVGFAISAITALFNGCTYFDKEMMEEDQALIAVVNMVGSVLLVVPRTGGLIADEIAHDGSDGPAYIFYFSTLFGCIGAVCGGAGKLDQELISKELLVLASLFTSGLAGDGEIAAGALKLSST